MANDRSNKALIWIAGAFVVLLTGGFAFKKYIDMRMAGANGGDAFLFMVMVFVGVLAVIGIAGGFIYYYMIPEGRNIHKGLMYANATTFNDPFDCHPNLIDFSKVPSERCKIWDAAVIEDLESNRYINNRNDLWICCLSKVYDSLLMWSYYNKHVGVCIGLNMEYVKKYIHVGYGMMVTTQGREVDYTDIIKKPDYFRDYKDFFNYQIFTKAKAWEHEQEVRLYVFKPSPMFMALLPFQQDKNELNWKEVRSFIKIGPECFDSIYLGVNISNTDRDRVICLAKKINPEINVYQMIPDTTSFNLIASGEEEIW